MVRKKQLGIMCRMRQAQTYESNSGISELEYLAQAVNVAKALNAPEITISRGSSQNVKSHIQESLASSGWATNVKLDVNSATSLNAFHHSGIALQVQIGNVARAFYDLLKLEAVNRQKKISVGILVVPTRYAAQIMGDNLANFERLSSEHQLLFKEIISIPLVVYSFE